MRAVSRHPLELNALPARVYAQWYWALRQEKKESPHV